MNGENGDEKTTDVKSRVMASIKAKKVKMKSKLVFAAEKMGLEGALALAVI